MLILSKLRIIGAAEGNIIATIIMAHITKTTAMVDEDHDASIGIISFSTECDTSKVIQATNAQLAARIIAMAVITSAWRNILGRSICVSISASCASLLSDALTICPVPSSECKYLGAIQAIGYYENRLIPLTNHVPMNSTSNRRGYE